ncbi:hypothetical protein GY45DRAFT_1354116 [Cubamyces sp. BRFM 1775]|nr:hypothetical protein GY45DRAFT_1354116 [Cubamyces sp. BRFM 1775]
MSTATSCLIHLAKLSGHYNDALRHKERKVAFYVKALSRLAAGSVGQDPEDVVSFDKLAEGGFNRAFVITLRDGRQVVARVPYPMTVPNYYAVASEVATTEYLRSYGIPIPEIYGYSADSDNEVGTPYIIMEFIQASRLRDVWSDLGDEELESRMMALPFPAGGSLYFTKDLEKVAPGLRVPLEDARYSVGPDTMLALWYGRRGSLRVNRGPYESAEAALAAPAHKEIAYLKQFGRPLLPLRRERRPAYEFYPQSPSSHVENLERYLSITPSLIPEDPTLRRFCIRHPDFQPNNVFVSRLPNSGCKVVSVFDWQHTSILPMFLLAGIPQRFQNHGDAASQSEKVPSLPEDFDKLGEARRSREKYLYRRCLIHYHYVSSTKKYNPLHYAALKDDFHALRGRLFLHAGAPWEGESFDLKDALIQATKSWEELAGVSVPCPIKFDAKDLHEMKALDIKISGASRGFGFLQAMRNVGEEGWVENEDYESAVAFFRAYKEEAMKEAQSEKEREEILTHWPWDDMDEGMYM